LGSGSVCCWTYAGNQYFIETNDTVVFLGTGTMAGGLAGSWTGNSTMFDVTPRDGGVGLYGPTIKCAALP
jgi:hypothetical protein